MQTAIGPNPLRLLAALLLTLTSLAGPPQPAFALLPQETIEQTVVTPKRQMQSVGTSTKNMVATVHPLATDAALDVLADGGNAVDAAVAAGLTLGVVDGFNSGIGGGCFILIRTPDGNFYAIDGRETAPAAAHVDLFKEAEKTMKQPSRVGPLASGVPGALAAFSKAARDHGKLGLARLIKPGAEIAEQGFVISDAYETKLKSVEKTILQFPATADVLLRSKDGELSRYRAGEVLVQKDLAATYRSIAKKGTAWFYNGPFAKKTAEWMKANGGIITEADFANYQTVSRKPVQTTYRDHTVVGFPPPSSGGVHVGQILNILETYDLAAIHQQEPAEMYHLIGEAMKFAFADRAHWLGDPDFVDVPRGLIDAEYAAKIATKISRQKAGQTEHGTPPASKTNLFERHTTHIAAADSEGYFVAITSTVNTTFGSKVIVPGLGVVMNNQMDDFVAILDRPNAYGLVGGRRNAVEARKRPLSSMSPTILLRDDQTVLTLGAAGGPKIITEVVNAIIHHVDLKKPIDQAIAQPRIHHQWSPNLLMLEQGFDEQVADKLRSKGHQVLMLKKAGICQGISFDPQAKLFRGAADPRTTGAAAGN
ncbi:MAG: gamma-glutamyltransferase [Planctomycetota bacterium]